MFLDHQRKVVRVKERNEIPRETDSLISPSLPGVDFAIDRCRVMFSDAYPWWAWQDLRLEKQGERSDVTLPLPATNRTLDSASQESERN